MSDASDAIDTSEQDEQVDLPDEHLNRESAEDTSTLDEVNTRDNTSENSDDLSDGSLPETNDEQQADRQHEAAEQRSQVHMERSDNSAEALDESPEETEEQTDYNEIDASQDTLDE